MPKRLLLVPLLAVSVLLAGCDGRLSKKDYISKSDKICAATNTAADKLPTPPKDDLAANASFVRNTADLLLKQTDQILALKPPKKDAPQLLDLWNREKAALQKLQQSADAVQLGAESQAATLRTQATAELIDIRSGLKSYGFKDCASQ